MSAALSRRAGRASYHPPIFGAPPELKLELARRTADRFTEFEDLPEHLQRLILDAEASRERLIALMERGDQDAVQRYWEEAIGLRRPAAAAV
jgi:hypothetical protein